MRVQQGMLPETELLESKGQSSHEREVDRGTQLAGRDLEHQSEDSERSVVTIIVSLRRLVLSRGR